MKAFGENRGRASLILKFDTRWRWVFIPWSPYSQESNQVPNKYVAGCISELLWTHWYTEQSITFAGIRSTECPAHGLVTTPNNLKFRFWKDFFRSLQGIVRTGLYSKPWSLLYYAQTSRCAFKNSPICNQRSINNQSINHDSFQMPLNRTEQQPFKLLVYLCSLN
jgi:hypothetical protein